MSQRYTELLREWTRLREERRLLYCLNNAVELATVNQRLARLTSEMRAELRRPTLEVLP